MDAYALSMTEASTLIARRELSPVELTESVLARIEQTEPLLNAYVMVTAEQALERARAAEAELAGGAAVGELFGMPLGVKDIYDSAGDATTASSLVRQQFNRSEDSTVVARLRSAGMIMVGKTHTHEFAMGGVTPTTRNPWDTGHIPGGSSGGSGAAVAVGSCAVGLGSDTGGSIRIPASFCGTVGLKPTYGLVSRAGVTSLSWSLDHVGPLTRTVRDTALVMDVIAGYERRDPATVELGLPAGRHTAAVDAEDVADLSGLTIGVPDNLFFEHCDPQVEAAVRAAIAQLGELGARLVAVTIPRPDLIAPAAHLIVRSEAAAYHRRMLREHGELYTAQVRKGVEAGNLVPAIDYIDALRIRTLVQNEWAEMVRAAGVDAIAAPSNPITAPSVELGLHTWPDGVTEDLSRAIGRYSSPANLTGIPGLSVPVGLDAAGLPIGMQLMGRPFDETTLLKLGTAYEATQARLSPVLP